MHQTRAQVDRGFDGQPTDWVGRGRVGTAPSTGPGVPQPHRGNVRRERLCRQSRECRVQRPHARVWRCAAGARGLCAVPGEAWVVSQSGPVSGIGCHEPAVLRSAAPCGCDQRSFGWPGTATSSTNVSAPRKSAGLAVYSGRALLAAVAAIIRSEARVRGWRPAARTAAQICP